MFFIWQDSPAKENYHRAFRLSSHAGCYFFGGYLSMAFLTMSFSLFSMSVGLLLSSLAMPRQTATSWSGRADR